MKPSHLVAAILVMMTSNVGCIATADGQNKASETQHLLNQQPQQQPRQASSPPAATRTGGNSNQQEGSIVKPLRAAGDVISGSSTKRPRFVGDRLIRSFNNRGYTINGAGTVGDSVHSVAKRAVRPRFVGKRLSGYEHRKAPWFVGKRDLDFGNTEIDDDLEDEWTRDVGVGDLVGLGDNGAVANFIGNGDSYSEGFGNEDLAKRAASRFIDMRSDRSGPSRPVFVGRRSGPSRPVFVGKRSIRHPRRPLFVGKRLTEVANDELILGSNPLYDNMNAQRIRPSFVRRRRQGSNLGDHVNEIIRLAQLGALRERIIQEKRKYAPSFVGKRDEVEEESAR